VGILEFMWDKGGTESGDYYIFLYGKGNYQLGTGFLYIRESHQPPRELRFVNSRMLFIILRHCWCVIFLKAYGPAGDKSDD